MSNFKDLVRIGKGAVTRFTKGGDPVTGFSAAFDTGWGDKKQTNWLDCSIWGERGEKVAQYLTKGAQVMVEGDIGTREHDGKTYLTLRVNEVKLTGGKQDGQQRGASPGRQARGEMQTPASQQGEPFPDDDIPF